jgi:hypothetical protein
MHLLRSGKSVPTFFDLLGKREDDMTFGLGLVASRSERFLSLLVERITGTSIPCADGLIRLQTTEQSSRGRTDVEIEIPGRFAGVLEAKRGTNLPTINQLARYVPILHAIDAPYRRLTAVTNAPPAFASRALPPDIDGIEVNHLTWRELRLLAGRARRGETNRNKQLLDEFTDYLTEILGMEKIRSNMVWVVALNNDMDNGITFRDWVYVYSRYNYWVEGSSSPEPPNYIAFRFDERLHSIHHVEGYDVFTNPHDVVPEATDVEVRPFYSLQLGPNFFARPDGVKVKAGPRVRMANRVSVMLDTLFTCTTISAALDETERRERANGDS